MGGSWEALLPFLIVIPIAIWTKQVVPALFVSLLVGSYLVEPSLLGGIKKMLYYLVTNLVKSSNIRVILFLYVFAGLISIIKLAGGIKGFVYLVGKKVKSRRSALLLTWFSTLVTFSDPDFRIVTIAPILKSLKERLKLSSQELGFTVEVTSNPVVGMIPLATAFVGYMVSIIGIALQHAGIHQKPYLVYVKSIPFNFFSFAILIVGAYYSFFKPNKRANAPQKKLPAEEQKNPNAEQGEEGLEECYRAFEKDAPTKPWNLIIPIALMLLLTLFLSWWDGHAQAKGFFDAFVHADALGVMLEALFIATIFTLAFFIFQRFSIAKLLTHFVKGGNELMSVILMLALIWGVSAVSEDLGFSEYITAHVKGIIPHFFVAPAVFILGSILSYFIGSSWGTWGLLMPLGVNLAHQAGGNILLVIGAVFVSGTVGAFASPLSDNTVTLCTIMDLPVIDYAKTKLVPTLIAAALATVMFGVASFVV